MVCLLSYEYPPRAGGEASYTEGLALSLCRGGIEVIVVTSASDGGQSTELPHGLRVMRLGTCSQRPMGIASFQAAASLCLSRMWPDVDIIHQTNDYFFPLPSRRPVDIVTMHHPFGAEEKLVRTVLGRKEVSSYLRQRHMHYLRSMQKMACQQVPRILSVSRFTAITLSHECGIPPERFSIHPNGVLLERFEGLKNREGARTFLDLEPSSPESLAPVLLHVGRLDYNKDLSSLLTAFTTIVKEWPDCRLLIIGAGPLHKWVRDFVTRTGLDERVSLLGAVDSNTLLDAYSAADVVVLSSLMEGFGIVLTEAMAARRPCVATRCGATEEVVVDGETGFLVPPLDPDRLAGAISKILSEPNLGKKFGKAGRKRVERLFDWSVLASRITRYYEEAQLDPLSYTQ